MLYLYHAPSSVCAMKVRLVLNEKGLPWDGKILDLRRGDSGEPLGRRRLDDAAENIDGHAVFPHRARSRTREYPAGRTWPRRRPPSPARS